MSFLKIFLGVLIALSASRFITQILQVCCFKFYIRNIWKKIYSVVLIVLVW